MSYFLRIFYPDYIQDYPLDQSLNIGKDGRADVSGTDAFIRLCKSEDGYMVSGAVSLMMKEGSFLDIARGISALLVRVENGSLVRIGTFGKSEILIGRNPECQLKLPSRKNVASDIARVSRKHVRLIRSGVQWAVEPVKKEAEVYLNGKLVKHRVFMDEQDVLCLGKYTIYLDNGCFTACVECFDFEIKKKEPKELKLEKLEEVGLEQTTKIFIAPEKKAPVFNRGPHKQKQISSYQVRIPLKENVGEKPETNWVSVFLPSIVMLVIMLGIFFLTGSITTLVYTVPMYVVSMIVTVLNHQFQKKKFEKRKQIAEANYQGALAAEKEKIQQIKSEQKAILENEYPSLSECADIVMRCSDRLWRRRPLENEFMKLRLGTGDVASAIQMPQSGVVSVDTDFINEALILKNAPVGCPIKDFKNVGLTGNRLQVLKQMKNMVVQTIVNHSYDEVKIVSFFPQEEQSDWDWMRWLPHVFDRDRKKRFLACENGDIIRLCRDFEDILQKRLQFSGHSKDKKEHILFLIGDYERVAGRQLMKYLESEDQRLNISTIFLAGVRNQLPGCCKAIIEVDLNNTGKWYSVQNSGDVYPFRMDEMSDGNYDSLARKMAPIRLPEGAGEQQFPSAVTFLEGHRAKNVGELRIQERWKKGRPEKSMAVPVGIKKNGDLFYFNIHEKVHGPHGITAGQAGSGKSEMVQSWLLSMALNFPPVEVSFVLIDYKGDGLLKPFKNLPHLAGSISNLDHNIWRNVIALEQEMIRRETLFKKSGAHDILDYKQKYRRGEVKESLCYLIIVIDEFAEFKTQHPEFIDIIDQIYTKGRAAGMQIMTLAQDPTSVITPKIAANSAYRWCMQVANNEASRGMLGNSDAYTMDKVPGRGYIKVGNFDTYELIQSFWSGAPYCSDERKNTVKFPPISHVTLNGNRMAVTDWEKSVGIWSSEKEIDKVAAYIRDYVDRYQVELPPRVWMPPLGKTIMLDACLAKDKIFDGEKWGAQKSIRLTVGMVDDPRKQVQYPLTFYMKDSGHISLQGGPGSGKTFWLMAAIVSLAKCYSPGDVWFYLFDYDKWTLNQLGDLPHTAGVCTGDDVVGIEEKIGELSRELNRRETLFGRAKVVSFEDYCAQKKKIPAIFVVVDGITDAWDDSLKLQEFLKEIAKKGVGYGIYLLVTAPGTTFPYKLDSYFKTRLTLNQNERSDYTGIVGSGMIPENYPGRGLVKLENVVEFQTALPVSEKKNLNNQEIRNLALQMKNAWEKIRSKTEPPSEEKRQQMNSGDSDHLVIGLDSVLEEPVEISLKEKHCLVLSSMDDTVRGLMLKGICNQLIQKEVKIVILDDKQMTLKNCCQKYAAWFASGDSSSDRYIEELIPEISRRQKEKEISPEKEFPMLVLVIAEWKEFFTAAEDQTISYLREMVMLGKNLGIYLVVAGRAEGIIYLGQKGEKMTCSLLKQKHAILLGGSFQEHQVFESALGYTEASGKLKKQEGYYLLNGNAKLFEMADEEMQEV